MSLRNNSRPNIEALLSAAYEVAEAQKKLSNEEEIHRDYSREVDDDRRKYSIKPLPGADNLRAVRRVRDQSEESYEEWSGAVDRKREWVNGTRTVTQKKPFTAYYFSTGISDKGKAEFTFIGSSNFEDEHLYTWELTLEASQLADVEIIEKVDREETARWVGREALVGAS